MANKYKRNSDKRFGIAGGSQFHKRKWVRRKKYSYKYVIPNQKKRKTYSTSLKIVRKIISHKYYHDSVVRKRKLRLETAFEDFQNNYVIRKIHKECEPGKSGGLSFAIKRISNEVEGYRLISMNKLQNFLTTVTLHSIACKPLKLMPSVQSALSPIKFVRELRQYGLASVFITECQGCGETFKFETSPQVPLKETNHYDANIRAVWGSMVTGGGMSSLNELMGTMNCPGISQPSFSKIEQDIGDVWEERVQEELLSAGAEERKIAIEKGDYHEGVPCITVIADGGWSKRSHRHTYNAMGGVGVIIGAETGKVLHIGVRNKHCYICSAAETKHIEPSPHRCFKNWTDSSQAMEADIIVDGFQRAERIHGLRYTKLIADGDSSVYAKIIDNVPGWGKSVQKLECANHVCKCLRTNLEKLVENNAHYKGKGRLTKSGRIRIVSAVRCAIRLRSKEEDKREAAKKLEKDIRNTVYHVFGQHTNCSDFCKAKDSNKDQAAIDDKESTISEETIPQVLDHILHVWQETTNIEEEEKSRGDCNISSILDNIMLRDISVLLDRVALKSSRLIGNFTTNLVESWMSIRSKFDGGKIYNRCNRGSWHSRCYGGSLRKSMGPTWSPKVWEGSTGTSAGKYFRHLYTNMEKSLNMTKISKAKPESKKKRYKRKLETFRESNSKKAKVDYGPSSLEAPPDISEEKMEDLKAQYMKKHINLSEDKIVALEVLTRRQSATSVWKDERKKRITSSNFGNIVKRNPNIKVTSLVKQLIYSSFKGNTYTRKGIQDEFMTIREYQARKEEEKSPVSVEQVGLVICSDNKFLATSPDGKVVEQNGNVGLIEIKNLLQNKPINLYEAAKNTSFCLKLDTCSHQLELKKNHNYYYQIQGQMNILKLPWVDFVVRTEKPYQLHVERIYRDQLLWTSEMLPKLKAFYFKSVLPELAAPTYNTISGIREPGCWYTQSQVKRGNKPSEVKRKGKEKTHKVPQEDSTTNPDNISIGDEIPCTSASSCIRNRSRRLHKVKFVGRRISHEWIEDEEKNIKKWYSGTVTCTISGEDGDEGAIY